MKLRNTIITSIAIFCIIVAAIIVGAISQIIINNSTKNSYPTKYSEYVEKYSYDYGVPQYVVYSTIKAQSNFDSGSYDEDTGAIGLMKLTPSIFTPLTSKLKENLDSAMLYDPKTNIKYGTYYLSLLYVKYGSWDAVYAAYYIGQEVVDDWVANPTLVDKNGKLLKIPDKDTKNYVNSMIQINKKYLDIIDGD